MKKRFKKTTKVNKIETPKEKKYTMIIYGNGFGGFNNGVRYLKINLDDVNEIIGKIKSKDERISTGELTYKRDQITAYKIIEYKQSDM